MGVGVGVDPGLGVAVGPGVGVVPACGVEVGAGSGDAVGEGPPPVIVRLHPIKSSDANVKMKCENRQR